MQNLVLDIRYALRQLRKSPGFAVTAILTLALGLGAVTAMLAVVSSVLVRPLDYPNAKRLYLLSASEKRSVESVSWLNYLDARRGLAPAFSAIAAYTTLPVSVGSGSYKDIVLAPSVTANLFEVLGVHPALGHSLASDDTGDIHEMLLSDAYWHNKLNGNKAVLGQSLKVGDQLYTIVGVMPRGFTFPLEEGQQQEQVWTSLKIDPHMRDTRDFTFLTVIGALKPGVTRAAAAAQGEVFVRNTPALKADKTVHFFITPYLSVVIGNEETPLLIMLGGCFVLLLIACLNTANLQIARATIRQSEMAVRSALGASRGRIAGHMLVESVLLSLAGGAAGLALALTILRLARRAYGSGFARIGQVSLDLPTFVLYLGIVLVCGVLSALFPVMRMMRTRPSLSLQQSGAGATRVSQRNRLSEGLVVAEIALTFLLLFASGLFLRTLKSLEQVPLGFNPQNISSFLLWPDNANAPVPQQVQTYKRVIDRLEHTPGIESAAFVTALPVSTFGLNVGGTFRLTGRPENKKDIMQMASVSQEYMAMMRIPVVNGRGFQETDTASTQPVILINQAFANRYLRGQDPLNKQILADKDAEMPDLNIVGVVGDTMRGDLGAPIEPTAYILLDQLPPASVLSHFMVGLSGQFAARTILPHATLESTLRSIVHQEAATYTLAGPRELVPAVDGLLKTRRLTLRLASGFSFIAILLAAIGINGVLAYIVAQRVREIGIRMALGATRKEVLTLFLRRGLRMTLYGLAGGALTALLSARVLRTFLYGVVAQDPITLAAVAVLILAVTMVAVFIPARRAASVDPMQALRSE